MRRILVTAVGGDIGNGILRILEKTDDIVYGCDANCYAMGMDRVMRYFVVPLATDEGYVPKIMDICRKNAIQYLIPVNEREIEIISEKRELFEDIGISLIIQDRHCLEICLDKYNCMNFLKSNDVLVPDTWIAAEHKNANKRCILKPRKSNGAKGIRILECNEAVPYGEQTEQNLIQAFVPGEKEYTVGIFSDGKVTNVIAFKRKLKDGSSDFVELVEIPKIRDIAEKISQIFDLRGYINVQMREWEGEYYIFEINPRISGTLYFRHMLSYSDVLWWLDMADGKEIPEYKCEYVKAVGLREIKEKFVEMKKKSE